MNELERESIAFSVGEIIPLDLPMAEGGRIIFAGSTFIIIGIRKPTPKEINLMLNGSLRIGIAEYERLGVLLLEYESGLSFEPTFDAGIEIPESVPDYGEILQNERIGISIIGYDISTQIIFSIRYCSLSNRVSKIFAKKINEQKETEAFQSKHMQSVSRLYEQYPNFKSMRNISLAMDKAGE